MNDFLDILHTQPPPAGQGTKKWTVAKLAEGIGANRCRVSDVLNNKPGHGGHLRPKLAKFIIREFPQRCLEMLASLNWDADGRLLTKEEPNHQSEFKLLKSVGRCFTTKLNAHVTSIGITINKEEVCIQIHP